MDNAIMHYASSDLSIIYLLSTNYLFSSLPRFIYECLSKWSAYPWPYIYLQCSNVYSTAYQVYWSRYLLANHSSLRVHFDFDNSSGSGWPPKYKLVSEQLNNGVIFHDTFASTNTYANSFTLVGHIPTGFFLTSIHNIVHLYASVGSQLGYSCSSRVHILIS